MREYNHQRHLLLSVINAVGWLSATDGCVILDRDLNVFGFGGIISIPPETPTPARPLVHPDTKAPLDEKQLVDKSWTRHKSPFQLRKYLAKSIA